MRTAAALSVMPLAMLPGNVFIYALLQILRQSKLVGVCEREILILVMMFVQNIRYQTDCTVRCTAYLANAVVGGVRFICAASSRR